MCHASSRGEMQPSFTRSNQHTLGRCVSGLGSRGTNAERDDVFTYPDRTPNPKVLWLRREQRVLLLCLRFLLRLCVLLAHVACGGSLKELGGVEERERGGKRGVFLSFVLVGS